MSLTLALLPLGALALVASLSAASNAATRNRATMEAMTRNSANWFASQLRIDAQVLSSALDALRRGENPRFVCARMQAIFAARANPRPFALYEGGDRPFCHSPGHAPPSPALSLMGAATTTRIEAGALVVVVQPPGGARLGVVRYDERTIAGMNRWITGTEGLREFAIDEGGGTIAITGERPTSGPTQTFVAPLGFGDVVLRLVTSQERLTVAQLLLTFLPLLMWIAASIIGFVVVDRLLVRPLTRLSAVVGGHRLGEPFDVPELRTPAYEIQVLGAAFTQFADAQVTHEAQLSEALSRQTSLTREVHHRVKNNLQVIASLISLHARATTDVEALGAYAGIQRRVDALAIVHRNHYAQLDEGGALELKPMMSELVANLRTSGNATIALEAVTMRASLDTATTLAFLVTELSELAINVNAADPIAIVIEATAPEVARMTLASRALRTGDELTTQLQERYQRVLYGLSRQLRAALDYDGDAGSYAINFAMGAKKV